MANIAPVLTVSQPTKVNELVNGLNRQYPYKDTNSAMNCKQYEIGFLHYNALSLSNKLLDIAVMLATEH